MSLKLQIYEDVLVDQQVISPSDASLRKQLSQSDSKWFIKPSNYSHLAELEIYPRVFLGSQWEAKDPDWFQTHRISHVLNVSTLQNTFQKKPLYYSNLSSSSLVELSDPENTNPNIIKNSVGGLGGVKKNTVVNNAGKQQAHVNYLKINVDDSTDVNVRKYFEKVIDFVRDALEGSPTNNVLIHCKEGKSRSVTMMLVFGMAYFNLSLHEAFKHFENKTFNRSRINLGFQLQLMNYEVELLESKGVQKPKNSLDFLNQAAVNSCRSSVTPPPLDIPVEDQSKRNRRSKKTPLSDITNTGGTTSALPPPPTKAKRSTVKLLPKKNTSTPVSLPQIIPPIVIEEPISAPLIENIPLPDNTPMEQQPVTPLRSPIRSRRSNHRTPSSIIKIPFSTLDNASYISPMKNKIPPTPVGTPSINDTDILTDDYSTLEFKFDEDDLEISKGLEDRVFMTTPLKKRKTDEDFMQ